MSGRHWAYVVWEPQPQTYTHTESVEHSHKTCAAKNGSTVDVECEPLTLLGFEEIHHVVSADSEAAVMREARIARDRLTGYGDRSWIVYIGESN